MTNSEGESVYPDFEYTEIPVPDGLYQPFYFDVSQNKWVGTSKEDFEKQHQPGEEVVDIKDQMIMELTTQLAETKSKVESMETAFVDLTEQVASIQGGK